MSRSRSNGPGRGPQKNQSSSVPATVRTARWWDASGRTSRAQDLGHKSANPRKLSTFYAFYAWRDYFLQSLPTSLNHGRCKCLSPSWFRSLLRLCGERKMNPPRIERIERIDPETPRHTDSHHGILRATQQLLLPAAGPFTELTSRLNHARNLAHGHHTHLYLQLLKANKHRWTSPE